MSSTTPAAAAARFLIHLFYLTNVFFTMFHAIFLSLSLIFFSQNTHAKISPVAPMASAYILIYCAMALIIVAIIPMNQCIIYAKVSILWVFFLLQKIN